MSSPISREIMRRAKKEKKAVKSVGRGGLLRMTGKNITPPKRSDIAKLLKA